MSSPSTHTRHNSLYNAAIAFNNAAVTLLERHHYKDAVDSFRDSISAIQTVVEETRHPKGCGEATLSLCTHGNDINGCLQETARRCARSSIATNVHGGNRSSEHFVMVKFSCQQSAFSVVETISKASRNGTTKVFTCVVIEPYEHEEYCIESLSVVCNSIIYNFGVVHSLLAYQLNFSTQSERMVIDELQQTAFDVLCQIEPFFIAKLSWCPNQFHDRGALLLCILFAQTMSDIACHLRYMLIWESYNSTLIGILMSISTQESLIPTMNRHAAMA